MTKQNTLLTNEMNEQAQSINGFRLAKLNILKTSRRRLQEYEIKSFALEI